MSKIEKLLDAMRNNPQNDWTISDIERICNYYSHLGVELMPPTRGSHYKVPNPFEMDEIITIPAHGRIKPVYVKEFVSMINSITRRASRSEEADEPTDTNV